VFFQHEPKTSIYQVTPSSVLPSTVSARVAARLEKIKPDLEAIQDDLGEWGLNYLMVDFGDVKIAIGSSHITFHNETVPPVEPEPSLA